MNCFYDASTRSVCARYQDAVMHGAVLTGSTWSLHALCTLGRSLCTYPGRPSLCSSSYVFYKEYCVFA